MTVLPQRYARSQIASTGGARNIVDWISQLWQQLAQQSALRLRFANAWIQRGLGFTQPRAVDPALLEHGLTIVCPGIESESVFTWGICDGLTMGGVPGAMRIFNWGMPLPGGYLANLCRIDRTRRRAADLARQVMEYQDKYPGRPIHLAAQSGGVGVVVFAAEALPPGREIEGLVLLNGALSPEYDLRTALRRCRKGILNSYSPRDRMVLGWGTRLFGTIDRKFCDASGRVGFKTPTGLDVEGQALYAKLTQVAWCREHAETCHHWGGHLSSGGEEFLARYIAPWVRG